MSSTPPTSSSSTTPVTSAASTSTSTSTTTPSTSTSSVSNATKPKPIPREVPPVLRPLEYMGIPKSVLAWKPRLPSRNWSIFLVTVGTLSYLYYDDRRQCRLIKQDYIDKVKHLSTEPMKPGEWPRKITVYATRSPGDDDYDKALRYFKKYVKPVLVAAGIDWEVTNGTRHGGLARELRSKIHERRRKLLGLEPWMDEVTAMSQTAFSLTPQQELQRELDGGLVLVGRPAYKEWAWALKFGWCTPLEVLKRDRDDELAQELAEDHAFDEVAAEPFNSASSVSTSSEFLNEKDRAIAALAESGEEDGAGAPLPSRFGSSANKLGSAPYSLGSGPNAFSGMMGPSPTAAAQAEKKRAKTAAEAAAARLDPNLLAPPSQIPNQPPICFVDFTNLVGWRNIPTRMYQFFRQRDKVRHGAELALTIVYGNKETAREFQPGRPGTFPNEVPDTPPQGGDLDWGLEGEERYPPYFLKSDKNIAESRESYYKALPKHLKDARDLARGLREPSKIEKNDPSKTEAELREDRFKKEKEWRNAEMGFEIIRPSEGVAWDERFRGSLRVFELSSEVKEQIQHEQQLRKEASKDKEQRASAEEKMLKEEQAQRQKELEAQPLEELPTGL
ncbi:related to TIM54 (component of the mitochondrial TIM22 translocase) [Melanopsichium pennsylvanicum]|uniref:Mitochondrial import inner membrane translocase subunit TIM54 n=2 Tax=Melanopsichium pennsylvanicum TaxID=63383 RepID=A0AAJ4XNJ5_9BASI|nr:related to TIM54 (component of the mitochondrial TIM22 translocase) [Melanopsichium pennsylvanicum 4]SNX85061.1 related to TIM54 (component of the mitochondrial TIM22 translocase) [Melanopsichium pennsylvanicum]